MRRAKFIVILTLGLSHIQIYSWMDTLVAQYPNLVSKQEIGKSYENRPMYVLKVGQSSYRTVCACVHVCVCVRVCVCVCVHSKKCVKCVTATLNVPNKWEMFAHITTSHAWIFSAILMTAQVLPLLILFLVQHRRKQASCYLDRHRYPLQGMGVSGYRSVDSQQGTTC